MRTTVALIATCAGIALLVACGGSDSGTAPAIPGPAGPVPAALQDAESAAEDVIDLALAGDRAGAVGKASQLGRLAAGEAGAAALEAGVARAIVEEFVARAAEVDRLAPGAPLLDVALAANRAFALAPELFRPFDAAAPLDVLQLDYLDFEAKLRAAAGDAGAIAAIVDRLEQVWGGLAAEVAGRDPDTAAAFTAHVEAMGTLAMGGTLDELVAEAQHGLDLVDLVEQAYG